MLTPIDQERGEFKENMLLVAVILIVDVGEGKKFFGQAH